MTDPAALQSVGWDQFGRLMVYLYLFTGLGLTSAAALLLGQAVVPSLAGSGRIPAPYLLLRWPLLVLALLAAALAVYAFANVLGIASFVVPAYYPRVLV